MPDLRVTACIPAYNAASTLGKLVPGLVSNGVSRIIIVNDASQDGTAAAANALAKKYPGKVKLVDKRRNEGPSQAILDAYSLALKASKPSDVVVRMDSDMEHRPEWVPALVAEIAKGKANAAAALISLSPSRDFPSWLYNKLNAARQGRLLGIDLRGQQSPGMQAFRAGTLRKILPLIREYRERYRRKFGQEDRVGIDLAALTALRIIREKPALPRFPQAPTPPKAVRHLLAQGREINRHAEIMKEMLGAHKHG